MKLWGGRFETGPGEVFERFGNSLHFDRRLIECDIRGSQAFARALEAASARFAERYSAWDGALGPDALEAIAVLLPDEAPLSATSLESYATCPQRFMLERLLRIKAVSEPEQVVRIDALSRGSVIHRIFERFYEEVEGRTPAPLAAHPGRGPSGRGQRVDPRPGRWAALHWLLPGHPLRPRPHQWRGPLAIPHRRPDRGRARGRRGNRLLRLRGRHALRPRRNHRRPALEAALSGATQLARPIRRRPVHRHDGRGCGRGAVGGLTDPCISARFVLN